MTNELTTTGQAEVTPLDIRSDKQRFPRLCNYSPEQAMEGLSKIVLQAFLYRGQQADQTTISFIATSLYDELMQEQKYGARFITMEEIQRVVKKAVLGGTEMFGVSVASLYKIILEWVRGEGHELQEQAYRRLQDERRKKFDESSLKIMMTAAAGEMITTNNDSLPWKKAKNK